MIALLLWLALGNRTIEQARKSGKDKRPIWDVAFSQGMFTMTPTGALLLTEEGKAKLEMARMGTG